MAFSGPLELRFIVPPSEGGAPEADNLEALCQNCVRLLEASPPELQFVSFLGELLTASSRFESVQLSPRLGETMLRPDALAIEVTGRGAKRSVLIECKALAGLSTPRVGQVVEQLKRYREAKPDAQVIFAFPPFLASTST